MSLLTTIPSSLKTAQSVAPSAAESCPAAPCGRAAWRTSHRFWLGKCRRSAGWHCRQHASAASSDYGTAADVPPASWFIMFNSNRLDDHCFQNLKMGHDKKKPNARFELATVRLRSARSTTELIRLMSSTTLKCS